MTDQPKPNAPDFLGDGLDEWIAENPPPTGLRRKVKPKAILAEVGPRMFAAAKAKPEKVRIVAEDEHGNAVIDRPYQGPLRLTEEQKHELRRRRQQQRFVPDGPHSSVGEIKWGHDPWGGGIGNPRWKEGAREGGVISNYDIFAVLREND
jgi:hypothetical protein